MTICPSHREGRIFLARTAQNNREQTVKTAQGESHTVSQTGKIERCAGDAPRPPLFASYPLSAGGRLANRAFLHTCTAY